MAWDRTYSHTLLIALDDLGASIFFNRPDLTISTLCWLVANGKDAPLKLWGWQRMALKFLGPILNRIQTDHMALAKEGDLERAQSTQTLLTG